MISLAITPLSPPPASTSSAKPATHDYGTVAVFEDLYGNRWDLVQFAPGRPAAA